MPLARGQKTYEKTHLSRSSEDIQALEQGLQKAAMTSMVYGLNEGLDFEDMRPLLGPASRFLSEVWINSPHNRGVWKRENISLDNVGGILGYIWLLSHTIGTGIFLL